MTTKTIQEITRVADNAVTSLTQLRNLCRVHRLSLATVEHIEEAMRCVTRVDAELAPRALEAVRNEARA